MEKEKLINCSLCGSEMSSKSKKCPSCGGKNKKPFYKAIWFWAIIAVVLIIALPALSGGENTEKPRDSITGKSTAKTVTEAKTAYEIGETATLKNVDIVVNKIERSSGSKYDTPKSGHEFVIVEVTIKNNSKNNITYNPYDFKMQNSQGNITDYTWYTGDRDNNLSYGELAPGGTVTGTIPFEQPLGDSGLVFIYEGSIWSSSQIKFNLQ